MDELRSTDKLLGKFNTTFSEDKHQLSRKILLPVFTGCVCNFDILWINN